ncbi:hypothetical protein [Terricaulis silvestris]|uniref:Uncharacterized protein n=1 Tax=Terricaulis silvestris TaxID=2686094 RepID=A0A6I6MUQ6_9CAUL|nr:hypothetical protein [Terricaulis silvestris]QGZ94903.1 hypothetical protein DSM104635_01738 [Terricaulis silvestris]
MHRFKVIQFRDACVRYEVEIEASSAHAALEQAKSSDCAWINCRVSTYDNAEMAVEDLTGRELIPSRQVW